VGERGPTPNAGVVGTVADAGTEPLLSKWTGVVVEGAAGDVIPDSLNLEGDRERDLRRDRTVDVTSTVCTCVGEGRVRVPPPPLENDIAAGAGSLGAVKKRQDQSPVHVLQEPVGQSRRRGVAGDRSQAQGAARCAARSGLRSLSLSLSRWQGSASS